ncbi:MAG: molybdopterin-dependent oxidoreductase [Candidatus Eisenbacteria bacterium]|nr:molybdopterin-dependent oxidoreductase [Candidatus Eisenbacteria bacterium]
MSEFTFKRRDFLKLVGIGVAGTTTGCASRPAEKLIPYLVAPNDLLPGVPYWYASTCRECSAGCGILVKTREGRAIKVEGNPAHPVNRGGLCGLGHAALQGLYHPDRLKSPMLKVNGQWKAIGWDEAIRTAADRLATAKSGKRGVAVVTGNATGSFEKLAREWAAAAGGTHLVYEAFGHEAVREANRRTFGQAVVPTFDFARAQMVVSFGADFLETFGSPVAQARGFAAMRAQPQAGWFVTVEPRLSPTGARADEWVAVRPGGELALALGMAHVIAKEGLGRGAAGVDLSAWMPEAVEERTDVPAKTIERLARAFASRRPSLAIAGGVAAQSAQAVALAAAVNLLNHMAGNLGETVRLDQALNFDAVAPFRDVQGLIEKMKQGEVDVLVVHGADPAYSIPAWAGFGAALDQVLFKISLSSVMDDTAERCDLVLPETHALESLGDAEPMRGVWSLVQPTMQRVPMFDARPAGDTLIALAKAAGFGAFPDTWDAYLRNEWKARHARFGAGRTFEAFWEDALKQGGVWEEAPAGKPGAAWSGTHAFASPELQGVGEVAVVLFPSHLHDGRGANKPWLQELPDRTTTAVWGSWVEIHPDTAAKIGVAQGDPVRVETAAGSVVAPAYLYQGIRRDTVAIPLGQGHAAYGRYAQGRGVNALALLPPAQDEASGALAYLSARARLSKAAGESALPLAQPNMHQADRGIAQGIAVASLIAMEYTGGKAGRVLEPARGEGERAGSAHPAPLPPGATPEEAAHTPAGLGKEGPRGVNEPVLLETPPSQRRPGLYTEPRQLKPGEVIPPHAITAYEPEEKVRSPRQIPVHEGSYSNPNHHHRWAMAIDINSCNGCQACVVACYAENNIPVVGPEMTKRGRQMAWLRIERYEELLGGGPNDVRFVPMMCQQCTDAPCEIVCPVYATYHNPEGLNAQVYNRCVGTRYCSNNCPYKVRQFNWFDYAAPEKETFAFPEPLNWQLNPDVTVRSKGVMEKCTFCVQRILDGKGNARDENRPLRDGEIQTACAQSCPTEAIVFGDLLDPESKVSKLSHDQRRYWVFNELNTKPGITYLKKLERESELA